MGAAGGNFGIFMHNNAFLNTKSVIALVFFLGKKSAEAEIPSLKNTTTLCPADACPAESQISRGGRRRNAEPDVQYGCPNPTISPPKNN